MSRQQLTLRIAAASVPQAEALLELAGAEALLLADAGDDPLLEPLPDEQPLWPTVTLRAVFSTDADLATLCTMLRGACAPQGDIVVAPLVDADWQNAARQHFTARAFGTRLWLSPPDTPGAPAAPPGRTCIRLHMGLAFGTGEHPTTALCLEWLDASLESGTAVLDYGCGSGVLAIAAIALGARHAWAVDHDPQALAATRQNATLNGVDARVFVHSPAELPQVKADVIVANILAAPLEQLAPVFAGHALQGCSVVLSGILERQIARVVAAYEPYFEPTGSRVHQGWALLELRRRNSPE